MEDTLVTDRPRLTTNSDAPVASNQNAMTVGPQTPFLLEDYGLVEKLAHQNRERTPERMVRANFRILFRPNGDTLAPTLLSR